MSPAEEQRVIELYKYYASDLLSDEDCRSQADGTQKPPSSIIGLEAHSAVTGRNNPSQISSPHTTLTALCQLAAIRLRVQRAGISLIARQTQYIVAESTKTLDLRDTTKSEEAGDSLWLGLTECNRSAHLCENTVCLPPARGAETPPCFLVPDLRHDDRFSNAPYVTGPPYIKFYCGTPITTSCNLNIGSFWVVDDQLLPEFTIAQKQFFGTMASLVMQQLEMRREVLERQRAMKMGQALMKFVEGKIFATGSQALKYNCASPSQLPHDANPKARHPSPEDHSSASTIQVSQASNSDFEPTGKSNPTTLTEESSVESQDTLSSSVHSTLSEAADHEENIGSIFARAAYLIREALDIRGCLFLDAAPSHLRQSTGNCNTGQGSGDSAESYTVKSRKDGVRATPNNGTVVWSTIAKGVPAEILAFAHESGSSLDGDDSTTYRHFAPIDAGLLIDLTKRYPNGTLWTFCEGGLITPTESFPSAQPFGRRSSASGVKAWKQQREADAEALRHYFPHVRQLMFAPLFDAALERSTAGCFAWSTRRSRVLTMESEVVFLKSFVNNVGAEISRMNTIAADKSKSDFIGSISHELRSPLHGMLAAAEFLEETKLDNYQKSLIATQVSCGKTLLQVIEHVLDFSKINSLARDDPAAGKQNSGQMAGAQVQPPPANTDIAELCEEVVEGSVAGKAHIAHDITALNSRPSSMCTSTDDLAVRSPNHVFQNSSTNNDHMGVTVLLDFEYHSDWTFVTQPGALRRILMNVLGNALKYTDFGYVKVRLAMAEPDTKMDDEASSMILLSVADTGRGISKTFLRTRLFRPFNQEDHLSTGCGLGLSIVKSLVATLKGTLEVQSEQGVGTTVSIKVPLVRERDTSILRPSMQSQKRALPSPLKTPSASRTVALLRPAIHGLGSEEHAAAGGVDVREELRISVLKTMLEWLQMTYLDIGQGAEHAEYVLVVADEIIALEKDPRSEASKAIVLLPKDVPRGPTEKLLCSRFAVFEIINAPFGPRKLARAVAACEMAASRRQKSPSNNSEATVLRGANANEAETSSDGEWDHCRLDSMAGIVLPHNPARSCGVQASQRPKSTVDGDHESNGGLEGSKTGTRSHDVTASPSIAGVKFPPQQEALGAITKSKASAGGGSGRLLLVDDNNVNRKLLAHFVKRHKRKLDYDCAENGFLAVQAARENPSGYEIIFMDVSMPGMDGLEATRQIRNLEKERVAKLGEAAAPRRALIVALTGFGSFHKQEAFASGVDLYMTKPIRFSCIGSLIDEWYESGRRFSEAQRKALQNGEYGRK